MFTKPLRAVWIYSNVSIHENSDYENMVFSVGDVLANFSLRQTK